MESGKLIGSNKGKPQREQSGHSPLYMPVYKRECIHGMRHFNLSCVSLGAVSPDWRFYPHRGGHEMRAGLGSFMCSGTIIADLAAGQSRVMTSISKSSWHAIHELGKAFEDIHLLDYTSPVPLTNHVCQWISCKLLQSTLSCRSGVYPILRPEPTPVKW